MTVLRKPTCGKRLRQIVLCIVLLQSAMVTAGEPRHGLEPGEAMMVDALLVRPVSLVGTVLGTAAFIVSLPFTLPSGSAGEAGQKLVVEPAAYTFTRPLGELD